MISLSAYHIIETLHDRGKSMICRALEQDSGKSVILKILRKTQPQPAEIEQFKREFAIAQRFSHSGIIKPLTLMQHHAHWLMVLEDIDGSSLESLLQRSHTASRHPPLPHDTVFEMALQLCDALDAVHQAQVIHKDINPANLIWNPARHQLQIIDFGIASELQQESPGMQSPHVLEGTLPYISPEHTGRMNRTLDYRADYYSLGITLYELLCGKRPFESQDAVELVHSHMAKAPDFSHPSLQQLPHQLLTVLQKLLAKNPEDRYQSMGALKKDLQLCQRLQLSSDSADNDLPLSHASGVFQIPQTLYGREDDIDTLLAAFARTAKGQSEIILIGGYSGVGKSAVVNEIHKPLLARRAYFVAGKCDQYKRHIPYAALTQAFQDLVRQLLTEPQQHVARWAQRIRQALGDNAAVITELIPELQLIIGSPPPCQALPPLDAQNRLHRLFVRLVQVFSAIEHPLVLFVDDLQWADTPTLKLIELLLGSQEGHALLVIGAYRDNEVDHHHPLQTLRDNLARQSVPLHDITLQPLQTRHICALIADTLQSTPQAVATLAALCQRKTSGNPFFLNQFLRDMYDRGLIRYDFEQECWHWDMNELDSAAFTDNVVELMICKIRTLPAATQDLLQQAASLGNRFELATLAQVAANTPLATHLTLWPALEQDLIRPLGNDYKYLGEGSDASHVGYRFLHDRVQQAAYALYPEAAQQQQHLHIGRTLLAHCDDIDEQLFTLVEQFNAALPLITDTEERQRLAALNYKAGRKAQSSAAYSAASRHMQIALTLLPEHACDNDKRQIMIGGAEAAYLNGQFGLAETLYPAALACSHKPQDIVACHIVQMSQYQLQGRFAEAITIQHASLALLGVALPEDDATLQQEIPGYFADVAALTADLDGEAIMALPEMQDAEVLAAIQVLFHLCHATYLSGRIVLLTAGSLLMTRLSLTRGNSNYSPYVYVMHAFLLTTLFKDYNAGHHFGRLALDYSGRRSNISIRSTTHFLYAAFIHHWKHPLRGASRYLEEGMRWSLDSGNLVNAGYITAVRSSDQVIFGQYLPEVLRQTEQDMQLLRNTGQLDMVDCTRVGTVQSILNLMGRTSHPHSYDDDDFSEAAFLRDYAQQPLHLAYYYHGKIRNAYLLDSPDAAALSQQLATVEAYVPAQCKVPEATCYAALILARILRRQPQHPDAANLRQQLQQQADTLGIWAAQCPDNFAAKHQLVSAEIARLDGEHNHAQTAYQQAIQSASDSSYGNMLALACECYGDYWLAQQQPTIAGLFLQKALTAYLAWGADGKAQQLQQHYPQLTQNNPLADPHEQTLTRHHSYHNTTAISSLDLSSILKATHALSGEIGMSKVLARLLEIVRENAGAQSVRLLLQDEEHWALEAESDDQHNLVLQQEPVLLDARRHPRLPLSLLRYVVRTGEEVVESDLAESPRFSSDYYVQSTRPRSVICLPILRFGLVIGVLYLENNLTSGAFTRERVEFLRVLAMQALISIDNARLYDSLERQVKERTAHLNRIHLEQQAILDNALAGIAFVRHRKFIRCNRGFEQIFGYQHGELDGNSTRHLYPSQEIYDQIGQATLPDSSGYEQDIQLRRKDGQLIWCATHAKQINPNDAESGMVLVVMDISVRKAAEQAMEDARQRAEDATRTKSLFLANMSHEIRTPMNAILGMTQLALRNTPEPRLTGYLKKILASGENLLDIINDILDFSKIEAGKLALENTPFVLDDILEPLSDMLVLRTADKPVEIMFRLAANVPQQLQGDPLRLGQILGNLASNAAKFTERGHIVIDINQLAGDNSSSTLEFSISDSGIGIAPEQLATLFQPFTQADGSITRRYGGTGLGLAICKQLVELMDGDISASSRTGKGSCFRFRVQLPRSDASQTEPPALPRRRVLVVDDNELAREILSEMVTQLGQEVSSASDGICALRQLQQAQQQGQPVDLVLIDWQMPGWNGIDTIARIRNAPDLATTPAFLMVSAHTRDELLSQAQQVGIAGFLNKPVRPRQLQRQLQHLLLGSKASTPLHLSESKLQLNDVAVLAGNRILLVDDNALNREVVIGLLEDSGLLIDVAENGCDAVEAATLGCYDLVLMDIQMPLLDGLGASRQIRAQPALAALPIIALTAHAMESDHQASLAAGMNGHLNKPIIPHELFATLLRWLPKHKTISHRPQPETSARAKSTTEDMQARLRQHFVSNYPPLVTRLQQLYQQQDWAGIQQHAHNLKTSAAYIDAKTLARMASTLENTLRQPEPPDIGQMLHALITELAHVLSTLQHRHETVVATDSGHDHHSGQQTELARTLLLQLHNADTRAEETLLMLRRAMPIESHAQLAVIGQLLDQIEYDQAGQQLHALAQIYSLPIGSTS